MENENQSLPRVHLSDFEPVPAEVLNLIPSSLVTKQMIVPVALRDGKLIAAVPKIEGVVKPAGLSMVVGTPVDLVLAPVEEIISFIKRHYLAEASPSANTVSSALKPPVPPLPDIILKKNEVVLPEKSPTISVGDLTIIPGPLAEPVKEEPVSSAATTSEIIPTPSELEPPPVSEEIKKEIKAMEETNFEFQEKESEEGEESVPEPDAVKPPPDSSPKGIFGLDSQVGPKLEPTKPSLPPDARLENVLSKDFFPLLEAPPSPIKEEFAPNQPREIYDTAQVTPLSQDFSESIINAIESRKEAEPTPEQKENLSVPVSDSVPETPKLPEHISDLINEVESESFMSSLPKSAELPRVLVDFVGVAYSNRAMEVLVNMDGDYSQIRERIRGVLVYAETEKYFRANGLRELVEWLRESGEKQGMTDALWVEAKREVSVEEQRLQTSLFLSETQGKLYLTMRLAILKDHLYSPHSWGMDPEQCKGFEGFLGNSQGVVLFAGPQDVNLAENLYSSAKHLATPDRHVVSVEAEMETWLSGIQQFFSRQDPVAFSQLLRVAASHQPNVLVANPLEKREHFEIVFSEALKGRLVLARSYAADTPDALLQMSELRLEPHLVTAGLSGVISKRRLRQNCAVCQTKDKLGPTKARDLGLSPDLVASDFFKGPGCEACQMTGFGGEIDIFEVIPMSDELRSLLSNPFRGSVLKAWMKSAGYISFRERALQKAVNGQVSLDEVARTTPK